jgi:hypothetical protein
VAKAKQIERVDGEREVAEELATNRRSGCAQVA